MVENDLTHYQTTSRFNDPDEEDLKIFLEKEKILLRSISPFLLVFSTLSNTFLPGRLHFMLYSSSLNLEVPRNMVSGKKSKHLSKTQVKVL